jgi:hypothetical protein
MARLRAVVMIHAPGLFGSPRSGQVRSACSNASWTASSARSKLPVARIRAATARPASRRNRRSTSLPVSAVPQPCGWSGNSWIGRSSIVPNIAPGQRFPASIASSAFATSST